MPFDFGKPAGKASPKRFAPTQPDPLADVEYTDDIEADSVAELRALQKAFYAHQEASRSQRMAYAQDSQYWTALCFRTQAHRDAFLKAAGAARLGGQYVNGHALARLLRIDLPD